ncbi:MAG: xanthine dehydrogenase accessory factor [Halocynthiibacter sp.]|jgi:xanthine dehydrogenase accessory factor
MSCDLATLRETVRLHGRVARIVVAQTKGSVPREVGAAMLVWDGGQSGTIGGGALEYEAAKNALLHQGLSKHPLGPSLGQCCGGSVALLCEHFDAGSVLTISEDAPFARGPGKMPLAVSRALAQARNSGAPVERMLIEGWMVEPISKPARAIWLYGAGHVGRAIAHTLAPLPNIEITWIDTDQSRFPDAIPDGATPLIAANPADAVRHAPDHAEHLILTYSHALDLELCHRILGRGFQSCGLIGSATKWARFRNRLANLGHSPAQISRICCPIGQPALGKHPQAIAISVAAALLCEAGESAAKGAITK